MAGEIDEALELLEGSGGSLSTTGTLILGVD